MSTPEVQIPTEAPVMVLPSALLFPNALMPLFIFEERYRAMLNWALVHDRAFCVALMKPGVTEAKSPDDFYHTAGLGMVRACVKCKDGTSNVMLQGLARVSFDGFVQIAPFRIAKLVPVPSVLGTEAQTAPLAAELRALCKRFRNKGLSDNIEAFLFKMTDPEMLADAVAHSFVHDPFRRQEILEEARLPQRLELIIRHIEAETPGD